MPYAGTKERAKLKRAALLERMKEDPEAYAKYLEHRREVCREFHRNNPGIRTKYRKQWIENKGFDKFKEESNIRAKHYRSLPWVKTFNSINQRIKRSKNLEKWGNCYRCYSGIHNFLSWADLKMLWERDKASEMIKPSIDRKDSSGHYTVKNSQYIEMRDNRAKVKNPGA